MDNKTLGMIRDVLTAAEKMRGAYFFQSPGNASARRAYEVRNSAALVEWTEGGHEYSARFDVSCSCANVYARGIYTRDGAKTTLTAIRNSYKRMAGEAR